MNEKSKPGSVALLVIDVQMGLFEGSAPIFEAEWFLENINTLITNARQAGVPVFFIQHSNNKTLVKNSDAWQLHPEIQPLENEDIIDKRHGNAFKEKILHDKLAERKVKTVVITGLITHGCVNTSCIGALDTGYQVILA